MKRLYKQFEKFQPKQRLLFFLIISRILVNLTSIYYIKYIIDDISKKKSMESIVSMSVIFLLLTFLNIYLQIVQNFKWHYLRYESINYLRTILFKSLLNKPVKYFSKYNTGDLISKVIDDGVIVAQHASIGKPMLYANVLQLISCFVILSFLSLKLSIFIFLHNAIILLVLQLP